MHLLDILKQFPTTATFSVPDWTIGCFRRRSISFASGLTDTDTIVYWLQSRSFTLDLRLPLPAEQLADKPLATCSLQELLTLADYEGWVADTHWQDGAMSWSGGTSFQVHDRWPEPGLLSRVGNCMVEHCASGAYVEDWRLQSVAPGPLVGLRLLEEKDRSSGEVLHRGGGLIINGNYAGLVRGRPERLPPGSSGYQLRDMLQAAPDNQALINQIFQFETSVAEGDLDKGFVVTQTTCPSRMKQPLLSLEGFERVDEKHLQQADNDRIRIWAVDALESLFSYQMSTASSETSQHWFSQEQQTLARYLKLCR